MNSGKKYNREETWDEYYEKFGEEKTGVEDFRSFAEQFADRGMKGFNKAEKESFEYRDKKSAGGRTRRYPEEPQAKLDLHGKTLDEAGPLVERFVKECRQMGLIFVVIIPGIGRNSLDGVAKLRPMTVQKLERLVEDHLVANFKSAEPRHGGFGALYVYLK